MGGLRPRVGLGRYPGADTKDAAVTAVSTQGDTWREAPPSRGLQSDGIAGRLMGNVQNSLPGPANGTVIWVSAYGEVQA